MSRNSLDYFMESDLDELSPSQMNRLKKTFRKERETYPRRQEDFEPSFQKKKPRELAKTCFQYEE